MKYMKRSLSLLLCFLICVTCMPGQLIASNVTTGVPTITLSEVVSEPGEAASIDVAISENPGLMVMLFKIDYDHDRLTLSDIEQVGLTGWEQNDDNILWLGEADNTYNGIILRLNFLVSVTAGAGDIPVTLKCENGDIGNHDEDIFIPEIIAGKVHIHEYDTPTYSWSDDKSSVTARAVCKHDASHIVEETVDTTYEVTEAATCDTEGTGTYTAVFANELFTTQTKTVPISAKGHDYVLTGWNWTGYTYAEAVFTCKNDAGHVLTLEAEITSVRTEPDCENDGSVVYTARVIFDEKTYTDTKTEVLTKLGHDYDAPTYTWSDDKSSVTARAVCKHDASHIVEETVDTTYEVTEAATCDTEGTGTYTAVFANELFTTQTKTVPISATGHDYVLTGWNWTGYTYAEAVFTCKNDAGHVLTLEAEITSIRTEPDCENDGSVVYTARVIFDEKTYTDTKTEVLTKLGHDYDAPTYTWSDDKSSVTARAVCKRDTSHVAEETVDTTYEVTEAATCDTEGTGTYTAVFANELFTTQTKTVSISATGHDYALTGWNWTGYTYAEAVFTCKNDAGHVLTLEAEITSVRTEPDCENDGSVVYTARVIFDEKTYTDTKTEVLTKLGHDYDAPTYTWSDDKSSVTARAVCKRDTSHVAEETVDTTYEVTEAATCDTEGTGTYTAVFANELFTTQTKTVPISATGHDYALTGWNWTGYTYAEAVFTCKNDAGHVLTLEAEITSVRTEPDCETDGSVVYTARVIFDEKTYTDTKTEVLTKLGHYYDAPTYTWSDDNSSVTARAVCKRDTSHVAEETVNTTYEIITPATCDDDGAGIYKAMFTNPVFSSKTKTVVIQASGHKYELSGWNWTGYTYAEAVFTCKNDAGHVLTLEAEITSVRTEPTNDMDGSVVYTAKVSFEGNNYSDNKTEILAKLGHDYDTPTYTWSDDNSSVTAKAVSKDDASHVVEEVAVTVYEVNVPATCETDGIGTYTAVFSNELFSSQTRTVAIPATGHDYIMVGWSWTGYTYAEATFICSNNITHIKKVRATIDNILYSEPTFTADGYIISMATVRFDGQTYTDIKTEKLVKLSQGTETYPPQIPDTEHGTVTVNPANPTYGSMVTITLEPDEGYTVGLITVKDKDGNNIDLTDNGNGTYFYIQPSGIVKINAVFEAVWSNPFVDVAEDSYYYNAVMWAVEEGITEGTSENTFSPEMPSTRAQMVTFIWRAAGCPESTGIDMPFEDVSENAYYYEAVKWAVENGITKGTSSTAFSPDDVVTRAQCVTFLYRALGTKVEGDMPFTDVMTDDYFYEAVLWAVENEITTGTSATSFSPNEPCLRSQIVTFLYRAYNHE